jgi:hypothetical protein
MAKKSTVARAVCGRALSCWKTSLQRSIAGSMCGVKTSSLCRTALRLPWMCTSWFFGVGYGTSHHHTSSAEIVDFKDAVPCEPLIPASLDTCTTISFLQHESWFIAEPDSPPVLQVLAPYPVAPSDPCKSMPTSQYSAKVRTFGAQPVFTETAFDVVFLVLLSRSGFSGEVPGCSDIGLLMCPCCATGLWWAQQILTLKWRHLNAMDFNVINFDILINCKVWTTSVPNFSEM